MATSVPFQMKARSLVWTLNNYKDNDIEVLKAYATSCRYIIWGYEIAPTTGTPHLQGYVCWDNPRSVNKFCGIFSHRPHVELQFGTHTQASEYCKKADTKDPKKWPPFEEFGELPKPGSRTDWSKAFDMLREFSVIDVIQEQPHLVVAQRALREVKMMLLQPKHREVNVTVLWGGAGTGKTRYAYEQYPDIYSKPIGQWWDGYTGQKQILLDDYYGYLPYSELLRILDRYPYQVPIKGGFVNAQWDTVIITSNTPPEKWYKGLWTAALRRRLHNIFRMESIDGIPSQTPYEPPTPSTPQTYSETSCSIET